MAKKPPAVPPVHQNRPSNGPTISIKARHDPDSVLMVGRNSEWRNRDRVLRETEQDVKNVLKKNRALDPKIALREMAERLEDPVERALRRIQKTDGSIPVLETRTEPSGGFDSGGFQADAFDTPPRPDEKPAPTPIHLPPSVSEPFPPEGTVITGPVVVGDGLEVRATTSKAPAEFFSTSTVPTPAANSGQPPAPDPNLVTDQLAVVRQFPEKKKRVRLGRLRDRQLVAVHARALIVAFEEVDGYDPRLHHNQPRPALWVNDKDYLNDVKQLVQELRRFNELLETASADPATLEKSGNLIAKAAEKACMTAAVVLGVGLAGIVMASVYGMLSHFEAGKEVLQHIPLLGKLK